MKNKKRYCHICKKVCNSRSHWNLHPEALDFPGRHGHVLPQTKFDFLCFNFPKLKNKNDIVSKYEEKEWSLPMLCKYVGNIDLKSMQFILNFYGVKTRSIKEARQSGSASQKRIEKTNKKRYGAKNVLSKGTDPWKKRNKTVKDVYGVDNVWQCLEKFVDIHKLGNKISRLNQNIEDILIKNNIKYKQEFSLKYFNENDNKFHKKFYDFLICGTNILIEANGSYWHADPRKYKSNDKLIQRGIEVKASFIWNSDKFKNDLAKQNGYVILTFWENEILNNEELKNIEQQILKSIKQYQNK